MLVASKMGLHWCWHYFREGKGGGEGRGFDARVLKVEFRWWGTQPRYVCTWYQREGRNARGLGGR